jgi:MFS family permease
VTPGGARHPLRTLVVVASSAIALGILQTLIFPALPAIQRQLHTSTNSVAWALTVFTFVGALAAPILGRLGDIFGRVRMLELVLVLIVAGCVVSGLAHSLTVLLLGRAMQGVGTSVFALSFAIARDELPLERRATGLGVISASWALGGGLGLVLSGPIVQNLSYEWIFWIGAIVFSCALLATHLLVPESPVKTPAPIDWVGALLFGAGLGALLLALSEGLSWGWTSAPILVLATLGPVVLVGWMRWELGTPHPLADLRLLKQRGVWSVNVSQFLSGIGMFMTFLLIPKFVETPTSAGYGFGVSLTGAGLFLLPWSFAMLGGAVCSGLLANRVGSRILFQGGTFLALVAFVFLVVAHDSVWQIVVANLLTGLGIGLSHSATANLISQAVPQAQLGEANGMTVIMRGSGSAVGGQLAATLVAGSAVAATALPTEHGYVLAFAAGATSIALALVAGLAIPHRGNVARRGVLRAAEVPASSSL